MNPKVSRTMFLICFAWVFALCLCAPAGTVLATEPDPSKTVDSIEVLQMPSQTVYVIGESFSAEGGVLQINYTDGTTGEIAMTDSSVKLSSPTMNTANTKNVTATYEKKRAVFKIEVAAGMCSVTFDLQYDGAPGNRVLSISKGMTAQPPELSARDGYEFVDWYANPDYTKVYDFETPVTGDITVYALWKKADTEYVQVTFDYDYYGVQLDRYSYPVEMGAVVSKPVADPVRVGYSFEKWVDEMGADFDFAQEITTDTTVLAQWQKAAGDVQTWIFEAEDTDLTGKIGPSYSGSAQEESMIIYNEAVEASGNRMVGYLYEQGISLEFYIASDEEVDDAQITVRITGEVITMSYDGDDFQVLVNGEAKSYGRVTVEATQETMPACADRIVINGASLNKGANLIQLKTNNTQAVDGTTFKANAPIVDCVKIATSAVLIWDENHGVPADNYAK